MLKRFVCLANSRKLNGRCIAGREILGPNIGEWLRPVSDREHEEVSEHERLYKNGNEPRVLDMIDIPLLESRIKGHQSENWLLDARKYWTKVGDFGHDNLGLLADGTGYLWANGHHTYNGLNDYVPIEEAAVTDGSLKLVAVSGLQLNVYRPGEAFGNPKRRVQADFSFSGVNYSLWVTDPLIEAEYLAQADGMYSLGPSYLTISLGEPMNGRCYKLVAAIIGALP